MFINNNTDYFMYRKAHNCVHIEADVYKKFKILYISKLLL